MREEQLGGLKVRISGGDDGNGGGDGPTFVICHGFGAPGTDLVPLAGEIAAPPGTRFVFPEAPVALPPSFGPGRAWWMIDIMRMQMAMASGEMRDLTTEIPDGLAEANEKLNNMLTELEGAIGMKRERLVLGGFSQGAMLSTDVVLRSTDPIAGLVVMSGTLLAEGQWLPLMEKREGLPVFQSHGTEDPLLPYAIAERLRDGFVAAGLPLNWVDFPGGHGIAPTVLKRLGDFLNDVLG
jgi:phospholipase/carboxylesterase